MSRETSGVPFVGLFAGASGGAELFVGVSVGGVIAQGKPASPSV